MAALGIKLFVEKNRATGSTRSSSICIPSYKTILCIRSSERFIADCQPGCSWHRVRNIQGRILYSPTFRTARCFWAGKNAGSALHTTKECTDCHHLQGLDGSNNKAMQRAGLHGHGCVPDTETDEYPICFSYGCPMVSTVPATIKGYIARKTHFLLSNNPIKSGMVEFH